MKAMPYKNRMYQHRLAELNEQEAVLRAKKQNEEREKKQKQAERELNLYRQ